VVSNLRDKRHELKVVLFAARMRGRLNEWRVSEVQGGTLRLPTVIDPDETLPPPPDPPEPSIPEPTELAVRLLDRRMPALAREFAGWLQRGQRPDELVGHVLDCRCRPRVVRRADAEDLAQIVRRGGARPDRLPVVVLVGFAQFLFHVAMPVDVQIPDTRALLAPIDTERRGRLDGSLSKFGPEIAEVLRRFHRRGQGLDGLVVVGRHVPSGWFQVQLASEVDEHLLEAARFCAARDEVVFLLDPEQPGEGHAAVGVPLEALGLAEHYAVCACPTWTGWPGA
jgi:hypothetical protein